MPWVNTEINVCALKGRERLTIPILMPFQGVFSWTALPSEGTLRSALGFYSYGLSGPKF